MVVQTKSLSSPDDSDINENSDKSNIKSESATNVLSGLKKRQRTAMTSNGFDSLEILRSSVQYYFNRQIDHIINDFIEKFFQPAIKNIKENTDETISDHQIQTICKNLLESCAKTQYSSGSISSPTSSRNTSEVSDSDNSECGTSLLHQALKRKRTESDAENLYKRQFFITTAPPSHYFNPSTVATQQNVKPMFNKPSSSSSSLLTAALTSNPKPMRHPNRPIFHLIPANRMTTLAKSHVELANLLNSSASLKSSEILKVISTTVATSATSTNSDSTNTTNV